MKDDASKYRPFMVDFLLPESDRDHVSGSRGLFCSFLFFFMLPDKCCLAILVVVLGPDLDPVAGSEFETSQPVLNPELTLISFTVKKGLIEKIS